MRVCVCVSSNAGRLKDFSFRTIAEKRTVWYNEMYRKQKNR